MTTGADTVSPAATGARGFGRTFWTLNTIEMWERLAYYNLRVMAPIYIMQADDPGGLHLSSADKGTIYAWWAAFQSLLPIVTGGFADRFGYKRTLGFSVITMMVGYLMMAFFRDTPGVDNFTTFFVSIMVLATGTAFFKPSIQGSLAHSLPKEKSSVGWGIFYWVVNVGAFVGHFLPGALLLTPHTVESWRNLFLASAAFSSLNIGLLFFLTDTPTGADQTEPILTTLKRTFTNIWEIRLLAWMLIMSGFWLMMYQLWDLQPNFIADWVDSSGMAATLATLPAPLAGMLTEQTPRGPMVPQQVMLSLNALFIIMGVIPMSWVTRHMRTLEAMLIGMMMATAGVLVAGLTQSAWILVAGILCFSIGEMTTGPKKSEYLGLIAPPGKKGLYLGYVNIPVGVGVYLGSKIAGYVYGEFGEKAVLALKFMKEKALVPVFDPTAPEAAAFKSVLEKTLHIARSDALKTLMEVTGKDATAATQMLWDTYQPQYAVWLPFAAVGVVSATGLWIFGRMAKKWSDMNA